MIFVVFFCLTASNQQSLSKHSRWTMQETQELLQLAMEFMLDGQKMTWTAVSSKLANIGIQRTDTECKNRFQYLRANYVETVNKNEGVYPYSTDPYNRLLCAVLQAYLSNK
jgi:Myb/SANT-like DNA-binding domain